MAGLHDDERKAVESPLVKRPARSKPEAARRTKHAAEAGDGCEFSLPAARDGCVSYVLRNRQVVVPITSSKPIVPSTGSPAGPAYKTEKESKYTPSWQTAACAQMGLEHYNNINQGDEHELVKAVESNAFIFNGVWIHANFLAKRKGATRCDDLVPKYFFALLKSDYDGLSCVSCVKMDPGVPRKFGGCGVCPRQIMHPVDGGYRNAQPFSNSATTERCVFTFLAVNESLLRVLEVLGSINSVCFMLRHLSPGEIQHIVPLTNVCALKLS